MYKTVSFTLGVESQEENHADVNDNWEVAAYDPLEGGGVPKGGRGIKNREASLTAQCLICTGPAAAHQHYGAVCCYSCRAFFRRGITRNYACVRGDNLCQVNSITRTNCKRCRYARCLAVGMKPELVDATLKRKQEEKRRQELIDIQHEMGIQTVGDMHSQTSQAVTGMMQLQQGGVVQGEHVQHVTEQALQLQAQHVLQAVQGLQQPLPRHLVQQQVVSDPPPALGFDRSDDSLLYQLSQALEGRKKVLLELRNGGTPDQEEEETRPPGANSVPLNTVETIPEYVEVIDNEPPRAHQPNQPLRQQTYYIFHPLTQTFEPITIAEFEENAVIEEVVVAEDYSIAKQDMDENTNTVVNEHDYIELANEDNVHQIKRPRLSYEEKPNTASLFQTQDQQHYFPHEQQYEEVERKPVIAPVIKERRARPGSTEIKTIKIEKPDVDKSNHTSVIKRLTPELIEETVRNHKNRMELEANKATPSQSCHILEQVVVTGTDLSKVIEETIGREGVANDDNKPDEGNDLEIEQVSMEQDGVKIVDIEELVDVCFEEELQKSVAEEEEIIEQEIIPEIVEAEEIIESTETVRPNIVKVIQRVRKVTGSKKRRQSGSPLPLKKRRKMHHFNQSISLNSHKVPFIGFTVEEQLKVIDLIKRRNFLQESFRNLINIVPGENGKSVSKLVNFGLQQKRELIASLSRSIFFDELGDFGYRYFYESWPAVEVVEWASWETLKSLDLEAQLKFIGWAGVPVDRIIVDITCQGGVALKDTKMFRSPWAKNVKDEAVFDQVVSAVGELLCGDSILAVMFLMVTMTCQPGGSVHQEVKRIQTEMMLLMFRYLASKMEIGSAAARAHSLVGCLDALHRCKDIWTKKRKVDI